MKSSDERKKDIYSNGKKRRTKELYIQFPPGGGGSSIYAHFQFLPEKVILKRHIFKVFDHFSVNCPPGPLNVARIAPALYIPGVRGGGRGGMPPRTILGEATLPPPWTFCVIRV